MIEFFVFFLFPIIIFFVLCTKKFLLKKEDIELLKQIDEKIVNVRKKVYICTRIILTIFIIALVLIFINNLMWIFTPVETVEFGGDYTTLKVTDPFYYIIPRVITGIQLFILVYAPIKFISNYIIIRKIKKSNEFNENEKSVVKKSLLRKSLIIYSFGYFSILVLAIFKFILSL